MPLTVKAVENAKPREKPYKLTDGQGLYLFVAPTGTKSWRANYTEAGKQKTRTYGTFPALALADARKAHLLAKGAPAAAEAEPAAQAAPTFKTVAKAWMLKHLPSLSNPKHRSQVQGTLERFAFPKLGDKPIDKISRRDLVEAVTAVQVPEPGEKGDDRLETAHRVAGRISAVFDYAVDAGIIEAHPAAHLTRVLTPRRTKDPMPCVPWQEAGKLLQEIESYPERATRLGLLLVAHTFPRVNEVLGFMRGELREDGAIWVVPAERMKGKVETRLPHVIPMSRQARAIVDQLMAMSGSELVLESPAKPGQPVSENTLLFALYRLGYRGLMTVHGFRALASTVLNEQSPFASDVIERQLAHKESDAVRAAYNRAEYLPARRELMQWWSDWLDGQVAAVKTRPAPATPADHDTLAAG